MQRCQEEKKKASLLILPLVSSHLSVQTHLHGSFVSHCWQKCSFSLPRTTLARGAPQASTRRRAPSSAPSFANPLQHQHRSCPLLTPHALPGPRPRGLLGVVVFSKYPFLQTRESLNNISRQPPLQAGCLLPSRTWPRSHPSPPCGSPVLAALSPLAPFLMQNRQKCSFAIGSFFPT